MNEIHAQLGRIKVIPVVVIDDAGNAESLARALIEGGLPTMEVTFRTEAAKGALERIARMNLPMLLGAGTVLSVDRVKAAVDSGARYIVSPGLSRSVVEYCLANNITVMPGIVTPTELGMALEMGVDVVKFFPAEASGGLNYLKAISAPFKQTRFVPTGGIDASNLLQYLKLPYVLACGGSWMVKNELIASRKFDEIRNLTMQAVQLRDSVAA